LETFGVVYCATNNPLYLKAAITSAIALHKLNRYIPVTIFFDDGFKPGLHLTQQLRYYKINLVRITLLGGEYRSREAKTTLSLITPYENTLYLDADVFPVKPIPEICGFLEGHDVAMVRDQKPTLGECNHIDPAEIAFTLTREGITPNSIQYNGGVILWRKNAATDLFFEQWHKEWSIFQKHDQAAQIRAIAKTGISIAEMPVEYNTPPFRFGLKNLEHEGTKLLHLWGGQINSGSFFTIVKSRNPEISWLVNELLT
jgi:hypothetical protein